MSQKQLEEISSLLLAYSAGEYHVKGSISEKVDELDMIISGINMLGEELSATNVSRDFFYGIFNSVSDFVFIVDSSGNLIDANKTVSDALWMPVNNLIGKPLTHFLAKNEQHLFQTIISHLTESNRIFTTETILETNQKGQVHGLCTCTKLFDRFEKFNGYLISIKDITEQKENENLILRTIISTQQNEQKRVADDLHDAIGQELSMAHLMILNLARYNTDDEAYMNLVATCTEILQNSVTHLREVCFDLMPSALVKGGLKQGVQELVSRLQNQDEIKVKFTADPDFPRINPDLEIAVYRILQEFINNMIKHAKASLLTIELSTLKFDSIRICLKDNGSGFDLAKLDSLGDNRGIRNMKSKVKAFEGTIILNSAPGKGTKLTIEFPIKR